MPIAKDWKCCLNCYGDTFKTESELKGQEYCDQLSDVCLMIILSLGSSEVKLETGILVEAIYGRRPGVDPLHAGSQPLAMVCRRGESAQPPSLVALHTAILGRRQQLWVISSQHSRQLGGGRTSSVKGVWAEHQEPPLMAQNKKMMAHWLVSIHIIQHSELLLQVRRLKPRGESWSQHSFPYPESSMVGPWTNFWSSAMLRAWLTVQPCLCPAPQGFRPCSCHMPLPILLLWQPAKYLSFLLYQAIINTSRIHFITFGRVLHNRWPRGCCSPFKNNPKGFFVSEQVARRNLLMICNACTAIMDLL